METDYPNLLPVLAAIASQGAAADDRRRSEILRSCKTLDDLKEELVKCGMTLSRSATYLRLQPSRSNTIEGKRHIQTVPVKLKRAENDLRKRHTDANFTFASFGYIKEICS